MPSHPEKLPRSAVLRNRSVIETIRNNGVRRHNRWMTLICYSMPEAASTGTVAFLTPKRIGPAHDRNRLRRRMREIYRRCVADRITPGLRLWIAKAGATNASFEDLKSAMVRLALEK